MEVLKRYGSLRGFVRDNYSEATQEQVDKAIAFAAERMNGYLRYDGVPMLDHDVAVAEIVAREIDSLKKLGVKFETDVIVGRTITIDALMQDEGFEAVFIGSGAGLPRFMGIEGENLKIDLQNAQADMGIAQQIAAQFAGNRVDMMVGIATPMAQAAVNACLDNGKPVIYTAVSDPVAAMLANAEGKSSLNVTGSCDLLPVEAQLKLIRSFMPEAKTIGILYTTSETNSESQLKLYQTLAPQYGFEIHKGYGTKQHMDALRKHGPSPIHRKQFIRFLNEEEK